MTTKIGLVAFSGGLDTSFLVNFCREKYGLQKIITATVNTGGFNKAELDKIEARSKAVGAEEHHTLDGEEEYFNSIIKYLIYGNVSRDGYPLCVGAERLVQGKYAVQLALKLGADYIIHGSTGAGNDQYRFDLVSYVLGQNRIKCLAPVREFGFSRQQETEYLLNKGIPVESKNTSYSYNVGLWGISIGGKETHTSETLIPEEAWYNHPEKGFNEITVNIKFERGLPISAESDHGQASNPRAVIKLLTLLGNKLGVGRHYHIGTSIVGKKARIAYESPAADILYESHRTLEKLTLTQAQTFGKRYLADEFGRIIHEAKFFDPYTENIKAFLESTQARVSGDCTVVLAPGYIKSVVADSPNNLLKSKGATYGEVADFYSGIEAQGACKLSAFEQYLYHSITK